MWFDRFQNHRVIYWRVDALIIQHFHVAKSISDDGIHKNKKKSQNANAKIWLFIQSPFFFSHSNRLHRSVCMLSGVFILYISPWAVFNLPAPIEVVDWTEAWWTLRCITRALNAFHDWHSHLWAPLLPFCFWCCWCCCWCWCWLLTSLHSIFI